VGLRKKVLQIIIFRNGQKVKIQFLQGLVSVKSFSARRRIQVPMLRTKDSVLPAVIRWQAGDHDNRSMLTEGFKLNQIA
jgi:hypothetical protein